MQHSDWQRDNAFHIRKALWVETLGVWPVLGVVMDVVYADPDQSPGRNGEAVAECEFLLPAQDIKGSERKPKRRGSFIHSSLHAANRRVSVLFRTIRGDSLLRTKTRQVAHLLHTHACS